MKKENITKDMLIGDLVQKYPNSAMILFKYGMHCIGCRISLMETIEQGCQAHGMDEKTINKMVDELNTSVETQQKPNKSEAAKKSLNDKEKVKVKLKPKKKAGPKGKK